MLMDKTFLGNWTQLSGNIFQLNKVPGRHWKPSTGKPEQIQTKAVMFETIIIFIVDPHRALVQTLDTQNRTATINAWKQKGLSSSINIFTVYYSLLLKNCKISNQITYSKTNSLCLKRVNYKRNMKSQKNTGKTQGYKYKNSYDMNLTYKPLRHMLVRSPSLWFLIWSGQMDNTLITSLTCLSQ